MFMVVIMLLTLFNINIILLTSIRNRSVNKRIIIPHIISVRFITWSNMADDVRSEVLSVTHGGRILLVDDDQVYIWTDLQGGASAENEAMEMTSQMTDGERKKRKKLKSCRQCFTNEVQVHRCDNATSFCNIHPLSNPCKKYQISLHIPSFGHIIVLDFEIYAMEEFVEKCFQSLCTILQLDLKATVKTVQCTLEMGEIYISLDTFCKLNNLTQFFSSNLRKMLRIRDAHESLLYRGDLGWSKSSWYKPVKLATSIDGLEITAGRHLCLIHCETVIAVRNTL